MTNKYIGGLRTEATHTKSSNKIITDAPIDNHGKGEAFSPTDLLCASLASCMLTIMGIEAEKLNINIEGMSTEVEKIMLPEPRKVSKVKITFSHPALDASEDQKEHLKQKAITCPVALSLSEELKQEVNFNF